MDLRLRVLTPAALLALCLTFLSIGSASAASISAEQAEKIAAAEPKVLETRAEHPDLRAVAERRDDNDWEVGFFADDEELAQVKVDQISGDVEESWTGDQVAWKMARGYEGAFGRKLNAPYVWVPLCALFVLGLLDWRRPLRIVHLDLLVLVAGFGLSHWFFNRGEIGASVPLLYPPLIYLLARMLYVGFRRRGAALRPSAPTIWLLVGILFLVGFRVALNVTNSNVIDVGFSGVIGADLIADGEALYGNFPESNHAGDTYGPASYYAYVPFEQVMPWSGSWDDLPAAHGAAVAFDLFAVAGLFLLGGRLRPGERGTRLGAILAFAWAACPYTALALESNTNDALVSALLVGAMLLLTSPIGRGALLALASAVKFAPLALVPLFATYRTASPKGRARRTVGLFALGFAATAAIVMAQTIIDPGLGTFYDRTVGFQASRESPFSIWGQQPGLEPLQTAIKLATGGLALLVAFLPRRRDALTVAALGAAVLIGAQLTVEHWFYLYIPFFLPLLFVALALSREQASAPAR